MDLTLVYGVIGGYLLSQALSFGNKFLVNWKDNQNKAIEDMKNKYIEEIHSHETAIHEMTQKMTDLETNLMNRMSHVLAMHMSTVQTEKGSYRTSIGNENSSRAYLMEKLQSLDDESVKKYTEFLKNISERTDSGIDPWKTKIEQLQLPKTRIRDDLTREDLKHAFDDHSTEQTQLAEEIKA